MIPVALFLPIVYAIFAVRLYPHLYHDFSRRVFVVMSAVLLIVTALHGLVVALMDAGGFAGTFFSLASGRGTGTMVTSMHLLTVGIAAIVIALLGYLNPYQRLGWWVAGYLFAAMAVYRAGVEEITNVIPRIAYNLDPLALILLMGALFLLGNQNNRQAFLLLAIGLVAVGVALFLPAALRFEYGFLSAAGATLVLVGLLRYAEGNLSLKGWRYGMRVAMVGMVVLTMWFVGQMLGI